MQKNKLNNKILFLTTLLVLNFALVKSQISFQKTFGTTANEIAQKVLMTIDNGYCILGVRDGFISLNKSDSRGNFKWAKQYPIHCNSSPESSHFASFDKTHDNGYIICGELSGNRGYLLKVDSVGEILWCNSYDSIVSLNSVKSTFDKGYIAVGQRMYGGGNLRQVIQKMDSTGSIEWVKSVGVTQYNFKGIDVIQYKSDSSFIMIGYGSSTSAVIISKFSRSGTFSYSKSLWLKNAICEDVMQIIETNSGNLDISGIWQSAFCIIEVDTSGNPLWAKGFHLYSHGSNFILGKNHELFVTSYKNFNNIYTNNNDINHIVLLMVDSSGNVKCEKKLGGTRNDYSSSIIVDNNGSIVLSGTTENFNNGGLDYYLIKTDTTCMDACNESSFNFQYEHDSATVSQNWGGSVDSPNSYFLPYPVSQISISLYSYDACNCVPPKAGFVSPIPVYLNFPGLPFIGFQFPDSSTWVEHWSWSFGDGTIDTININPIHNFASYGSYNVCLTVTNACGSDTFCNLFSYYPTNLKSFPDSSSIVISPNPFSSMTTLKSDKFLNDATLNVYNILGQQVKQINNIFGHTIVLNRDDLQSGLYFIQLSQYNKTTFISQLIITEN